MRFQVPAPPAGECVDLRFKAGDLGAAVAEGFQGSLSEKYYLKRYYIVECANALKAT